MSREENFDGFARRLREVLREPHPMVISPDIGGYICAAFLHHFYNWQLVGVFTLNALYLDKHLFPTPPKSQTQLEQMLCVSKVVFADHDINHPGIVSIGHHILNWSNRTEPGRHKIATSLNPNLWSGVTVADFKSKYPFGSIHLLLAAAQGISPKPSRRFVALLLHIDSTLRNALNYQENALRWLQWLKAYEENSPLQPLCRVLRTFNPVVSLRELRALGEDFERIGLERGKQGVIDDPTDKSQRHKMEKFLAYICDLTGWSVPSISGFNTVVRFERSSLPTKRANFNAVVAKEPFAYAIISKSYSGGINYCWLEG